MHISELTTRRPVATAMFFLALILIGLISLTKLPVNLLPDITFPRLMIWTQYTDIGPAEIEEQVTARIEEIVATVPGVRTIHSWSRTGNSIVVVEFLWGTDMDYTSMTLREKLDNLRHTSLAREVDRPVILRVDPRAQPIITLAITGDASLYELYTLTRDVFKRRFEQLDGVALATVTGGRQREIRVEVDMQKLAAFGISLQQVENALRQANDARPGGSIKKGRYRYALRTVGEFKTVQEIGETALTLSTDKKKQAAGIVRLLDVANIIDGFRERQGMTFLDDKPAIGLLITREASANTVRVAGQVLEVLEQLRAHYPEVEIALVDNQAEFIEASISQVQQAIVLGGILAFLVLFFFLHDVRNPVNIAISMPVSVIVTFAMMYFSGTTLNMISLGGLALGVGMLVDNSIVVLENIFRRETEEGMELRQAAVAGTREVSMPIIASTLTTIAVFFPILYIEGVAGQLFRDQTLTVSFSLLASLLVALALLPMLASRWVRRPELQPENVRPQTPHRPSERWWLWPWWAIRTGWFYLSSFTRGLLGYWLRGTGRALRALLDPVFAAFDRFFARFATHYYDRLLQRALDRPRAVLTYTSLAFLIAILLALFLDRRLMPRVEQGRLTVAVELAPGSLLEKTEAVTTAIRDTLLNDARVASVFAQLGMVEGDFRLIKPRIGTHIAEMQVFLADGVSSLQMMRELHEKLTPVSHDHNARVALLEPKTAVGEVLGTTLADLAVLIRGNETATADSLEANLRARLAHVPGVEQVYSPGDEKRTELRLYIDRDRAASFQIPPAEIAEFVRSYLHGKIATDFRAFDRKVPILVRAGANWRQNIEDLLNFPLHYNGISVPVSQLVDVGQSLSPAVIEREGQVRQRTLYLSVAGRGYNAVSEDVRKILQDTPVPYGFQLALGGQWQEMVASFRELIFAFMLAFVLVFMILAAQFESLRHPFVIMLAVPLALIGVIIGLLVTGQSFNIMSLIGLVVLVGIVVNDAIVKVDFINQERSRGTSLRRAILLAGQKRLRPILMTTITTVLGLLPMAIGFGEGAELRRPLAIAIIFGLSFATVLTLIVVPVLYQSLSGAGNDSRLTARQEG